ncbi:MAG: hypothetical protein NPIRA02_10700 [Nitrospirales bacterium]|nr:MAG: hypothetical protein NPIRA02_10700 [Nitrospirales bacterium]
MDSDERARQANLSIIGTFLDTEHRVEEWQIQSVKEAMRAILTEYRYLHARHKEES